MEKLTISAQRPELGLVSGVTLKAADVGKYSDAELLPPHSIFLVKGWTRALSAIMIMACCWDNASFASVPQKFV